MKGTSKLRSRHLSADRPLQRLRGCFLEDNAAVPPAYRVKVQKCASFVDILDVCKFTTFCDRKGYPTLPPMLYVILNKRKRTTSKSEIAPRIYVQRREFFTYRQPGEPISQAKRERQRRASETVEARE